jgi:hypothetical protein
MSLAIATFITAIYVFGGVGLVSLFPIGYDI